MSVLLRTVRAVPGPLVSTRLVASTVNALKVSPWTAQAWSARVSGHSDLYIELNIVYSFNSQIMEMWKGFC